MNDQKPNRCGKCSASELYLIAERLDRRGQLLIFTCRRCGATTFVSHETPAAEAERVRVHRKLSLEPRRRAS